MKRVIIAAHQRGLVIENQHLVRVLQPGTHWIGFFQQAEVVSVLNKLTPALANESYLTVLSFKNEVEVFRVKANELVLHFEAGILKQVLTKGTHVFWKSFVENVFTVINLDNTQPITDINTVLLASPELSPFVRTIRIDSHDFGMLFINGIFERELQPGTYYFWKNPTAIEVKVVDTRQLQVEIPGQEILTKDKTALRVNFAAQYQITDARKAVVENRNYEQQLYVILQLVMREIIGSATLDELLETKTTLAEQVIETARGRVEKLGVALIDGGIKDIILPGEIKDILNRVLIAEKQAQANMIMRREETASTRNLLNTAKLMEDNAMLFKLKEMEFVEKIAEKISDISIQSSDGIANQLKTLFVPTTNK